MLPALSIVSLCAWSCMIALFAARGFVLLFVFALVLALIHASRPAEGKAHALLHRWPSTSQGA
jgi:hypothetical protein